MFILTCLLVAQFIFSLVIFTVHFVTRGRGVLKIGDSGVVAFYFGLFVVILVMVNVLTSESTLTMFRLFEFPHTFMDDKSNCVML